MKSCKVKKKKKEKLQGTGKYINKLLQIINQINLN